MGYLCLMADITFLKHALVNYRQDFRSMTQETLADCCGISPKSIARLEDPKTDDKMSESRMATICSCLKIPQHKLWADIPVEVNFYGVPLNTATDLSDIIFGDENLIDFDVHSLPPSDEAKEALLRIAQIVDNEWQRKQGEIGLSAHEKINAKIKLAEAFQEGNVAGTFYSIAICYFDVTEFDSWMESGMASQSYASFMSWKAQTKVIYKGDIGFASALPPSQLCPTVRLDELSRGFHPDKERRVQYLEWGRGEEILPF